MTARLTRIVRHPIKAHGREELADVTLVAGQALPWDRIWAVAHEAARLDPAGGWVPCMNFARGAKSPGLMAISARLDESSGLLTLTHPALDDILIDPDNEADRARFLDWVQPLNAHDRARPVALVRAGVALTDTDYPSVSILSEASSRVLSRRMGQDLSPHRWRGNFWLDGLIPWEEFELLGREIAIGHARLRITERITRCKATMANPDTGRIDADTLGALESAFGHTDFGVYAVVTRGGPVRTGDEVML